MRLNEFYVYFQITVQTYDVCSAFLQTLYISKKRMYQFFS